MRLAIIGDGKMGRAVAALAEERGHTVTAMLGIDENRDGGGISRARLGEPHVAVEFTEPASAVANLVACARERVAVVCGTTGWYGSLPLVIDEVNRHGAGLLWSPNFSVGIAVLTAAAEVAARALAGSGQFDAYLVESHHAAKKDTPSGTAAAIAETTSRALGRALPVTSIRAGHIPGTHELVFDGAFEQLRLTHEARDRRVFAHGALVAAEWLLGRSGVFTMKDVVQLETSDGG
jgi:4-hydroxy-tetrahydrodipicolinate reductase